MNFRNNQTIKRILVIRLSSLGDAILTSHALRCIRNAHPNATLDIVTYSEFTQVFEFNPHLNNVFGLPRKLGLSAVYYFIDSIIKENGKYDVVIDLQGKIKSVIIRNVASNHALHFEKNRFKKKLFVNFKKNLLPQRNIAERYVDTCSPLGVIDDGLGLELWLPEENSAKVYSPEQRKYAQKDKYLIGIAPGAKHLTKRFPAEKFAEVCNKLSARINAEFCFIGSKSEKPLFEEIKNASSAVFINDTGSETILESARLLSRCDLLISNDSAPVHIAAARRTPVVVIFSSTVPAFGFAPFRTPSRIIETEIDCRPCSHIGRTECPKGHLNCLMMIEPESIVESSCSLLEQ
jgi:heptosyltransferase-2